MYKVSIDFSDEKKMRPKIIELIDLTNYVHFPNIKTAYMIYMKKIKKSI